MAALAGNTIRLSHERGEWRPLVTNAFQIYVGSFVFLSETTGLAVTWADTAVTKFIGVSLEKVLGTGTNACVVKDTGMVLEKVDVAGVDNQNDVGDLVYASNDNDLTLTANTNQKAIGRVKHYYGSSTKCDVELFTAAEHAALY